MQVLVNYGDVERSTPLTDHAITRIQHALRHLRETVTRVEVHLRDDKQGRAGDADKRCVIEARIAGRKPLSVTHSAKDIYAAVSQAAGKLGRAVTRQVKR